MVYFGVLSREVIYQLPSGRFCWALYVTGASSALCVLSAALLISFRQPDPPSATGQVLAFSPGAPAQAGGGSRPTAESGGFSHLGKSLIQGGNQYLNKTGAERNGCPPQPVTVQNGPPVETCV